MQGNSASERVFSWYHCLFQSTRKVSEKRNHHICHTQKSKADLTQELGQQNIMVTSLDNSKTTGTTWVSNSSLGPFLGQFSSFSTFLFTDIYITAVPRGSKWYHTATELGNVKNKYSKIKHTERISKQLEIKEDKTGSKSCIILILFTPCSSQWKLERRYWYGAR